MNGSWRVSRLAVAATAVALSMGSGACTATTPSPPATFTPPAAVGDHEPGWSQPRADPLYPAFGNPDLDVLSYRLVLAWDPPTTGSPAQRP